MRASVWQVFTHHHFTKLEVRQLQDSCMEECGSAVPAAIVEDASHALMGATAARVGMFTKVRHDAKVPRWCARVRGSNAGGSAGALRPRACATVAPNETKHWQP